MRILLVVVERLMLFGFVMTAAPALAAGGAGTQGPRFLGAGLDEPDVPPGMIAGISYAGTIQEFTLGSGASFPPSSEVAITSTPSPNFQLRELKCTRVPTNGLLATCLAYVDVLLPGPGPACKEADPKHRKVKLLALNARWDPGNARPIFGDPKAVIFACEDPSPAAPDPKDAIGAIGKCVKKGFFQNAGMQKALFACIYAMRADYCGNGLSLTRAGTPIAFYNFVNPMPARRVICVEGECFEASWDDRGASCMSHARYEHLLRLATHQELRLFEKMPGPRGPITDVRNAIDRLPICGPEEQPLAQCAAQYTDFYYDDRHQIAGPGPVNPVDAVTSQYVCKHNSKRLNGELLTRTKVRFPLMDGGVEDLKCCDTLGCPK
jgi:hypothetical protein